MAWNRSSDMLRFQSWQRKICHRIWMLRCCLIPCCPSLHKNVSKKTNFTHCGKKQCGIQMHACSSQKGQTATPQIIDATTANETQKRTRTKTTTWIWNTKKVKHNLNRSRSYNAQTQGTHTHTSKNGRKIRSTTRTTYPLALPETTHQQPEHLSNLKKTTP